MASERIAIGVLEELGYKIVELNKKIEIDGVEVGEVDAIVVDQSGEQYAVEIKAGRIDVTGIRQAYVNALLTKSKPLVIAKGYADEAARGLADKLGVRVIQLSDVFLVDSEELYIIIREVIEETLTDYLEVFYAFSPSVKQEQLQILEAIAQSSTIDEASERLGLDPSSLAKRIEDLKRTGIIPRWASKYNTVRRVAQLITHRQRLMSAQEESKRVLEHIKEIEDQFKTLHGNIVALNQQIQKILIQLSKLETKIQENNSQSDIVEKQG